MQRYNLPLGHLRQKYARSVGFHFSFSLMSKTTDSFLKSPLTKRRSLVFLLKEYDFEQEIDFDRAYIRTDKLEELRERTASKSLKLLSKKWLGVEHYYKVECLGL